MISLSNMTRKKQFYDFFYPDMWSQEVAHLHCEKIYKHIKFMAALKSRRPIVQKLVSMKMSTFRVRIVP